MKKGLYILPLLAIVAVCLATCVDENAKRLKQDIYNAHKACPINAGVMGYILDISYDDKKENEVKIEFVLNEDEVSIETLRNNEQLVKQSLQLIFSKGDSRELVQKIINAGADLSFIYKTESPGKNLKVRFSDNELKEMIDSPLTELEKNNLLLVNQLALENSRCPYPIQEGMTMVKVFDDGDNIVFLYTLDEEMFDISRLRSAREEIRKDMKNNLRYPRNAKGFDFAKSLGKNIIFRFRGNAGSDVFDIVFTPKELDKILYK